MSLVYIGESRLPYTNFANGDPRTGDLNADGTTQSDPVYIPKNTSDTLEIRFSGTAAEVATQQAAFDQFVRGTPCLNAQRGRIMERNSCRSPWRNTTNLSIRQSLPTSSGQTLTLHVDVFNVLNLLNRLWALLKLPQYRIAHAGCLAGRAAADLSLRSRIPALQFAEPVLVLPDRSRHALQLLAARDLARITSTFRGDQSLGARRNAWFWPPMRPKPTICQDELMLEASTSVQPDPLGI